MEKPDRELLIKEISSRLPYGIQAKGMYEEEADYNIPINHNETIIGHVDGIEHLGFDDGEVYIVIEGIPCELSDVCIYLRPMSSMTEEEKNELYTAIDWYGEIDETGNVYTKGQEKVYRETFYEYTDWLNAHHFDYRGLIERGLAIEVTEENNPYKE